MSRIVRSYEPAQPVLALGHGPIQWSTLPESTRDHVLALWMQMLMEHLASTVADGVTAVSLAGSSSTETAEA